VEKPIGLVEGPPGPTVLGTERQPFPVPLSCGTRLPTPLVFLRRSRIKVPPPPPLSCGGGTGAREPPPFPRPLSCGRGGRRPRFAGCHFTRKVGTGGIGGVVFGLLRTFVLGSASESCSALFGTPGPGFGSRRVPFSGASGSAVSRRTGCFCTKPFLRGISTPPVPISGVFG